ncbi:acyltransferase [Zhengella sp. ZM62]|uniref:acyltransferase n=1 Tax=Zhengella sedimenti TaxID=3390035 RepID=UPI003974A18C
MNRLRQWAKAGRSPLARAVRATARRARTCAVPVVPAIHRPLYEMRRIALAAWASFWRAAWTTPLFRARLDTAAPGLLVYGGMPLVMGPVCLAFGQDVRISGQTTITGRTGSPETPELLVGSNVDIGWQTTIAVSGKVVIGHNVRIAGRAFLAGYPGHPLDADDRAAGLPDTPDQCGDIILERDVWLATGVTVLAGVTIGRGTVVGAGSVVTGNLPPFVLAAGAPARVIRHLPGKETAHAA